MRSIIISIGDELILGQTVDTNAAWISARLMECGVIVDAHRVVSDSKDSILAEIRRAFIETDLIIISGGMGPTPDDLTRSALAEFMGGAKMMLHAPSLERVDRRFRERGQAMPDSCRAQAMVPEGAVVMENSCGSAPGLQVCLGKITIFAIPGVPSEMKAMFAESIVPALELRLSKESPLGCCVRALTLQTFGCGESAIAERLAGLMDRKLNPKVGTTIADGIVSVRICGCFASNDKAKSELARVELDIRGLLGAAVFGQDDDTLQSVAGRLLRYERKTVVTVESCTAGLLGKLLTDPPGASEWYRGGWIVYSDEMKREALGVPLDMLQKYGAVSKEVAECMAEEAIRRAGSDYSLAITGIAGPGGATHDKKTGTVWIALGKHRANEIKIASHRFVFSGTRDSVRDRSAKSAINLLRLDLLMS